MSHQGTITQARPEFLHQLHVENSLLQRHFAAQKAVIDSLERRAERSLGVIKDDLVHLAQATQELGRWHYYLRTMQHEINSLCDLLSDAMLLQKLEAGKVEITLESLNLRRLLESVSRHLLEPQCSSAARLVCNIDPLLPSVLADQELTESVLTDLLARGLKYSEPGAVVTLEAEREAEDVNIRVVAQRFAPPGDRDFATEIALCCRQIEVQQGRIICQSGPEEMKVVTITLPTVPSC